MASELKSKGLEVVLIDFRENPDLVRRTVKERGYTAPVLLDESGDVTGRVYGVFGPPTVYFVDRRGNLVGRVVGPRGWDSPAGRKFIGELLEANVSPELIAQGDKIYHGAGNCYACHGGNAEGLVGPNLTDAEWIHSKGTLDDIVAQVTHGVTKEESKSGVVMPPRGGSTISDDDVKAVAAYVYSLSHK